MQVTYKGAKAIIQTAGLSKNTQYTVIVHEGAFQDTSGNLFAGVPKGDVVFTTMDVLNPTLSSSSPEWLEQTVPQNADVVLTFDESISLFNASVACRTAGSIAEEIVIPGEVVVQGQHNEQVAIKPAGTFFASNTDYICTVPAGVVISQWKQVNIKTELKFTTADWKSPFLQEVVPLMRIDVPVNIRFTLTFSEAVKLSSGVSIMLLSDLEPDLIVRVSDEQVDGPTIVLTPPSLLSVSTTYELHIPEGAVTDLVGNAFTGKEIEF